MVLPATPRRFTPQEYLLLERAADTKSEFIDGQIFAMTGASRAHNLIAVNLVACIRAALRGQPCEVYQSDMRVHVGGDEDLYSYPDVVVACEPIRFADDHTDTLQNPVVIVEVLSPSTEAFDRGEKFLRYQRLPSLAHFVLVAQDRRKVEHFARDGRRWSFEVLERDDDALNLTAIGVAVPLREVYERIHSGPRGDA